jgi:CRISPR type III-A-associated RAMP protein Csm4
MSLAQIARFRPAGPWRLGPDSGATDRVDRLLHSDSLYSAVTLAMAEFGRLEEWLEATARAAEPVVRLTSAFPFHGDTLFAPPPMNHWPPAPSPRVRWKGARFVPIQAIARLLREGGLSENDWIVDAESECLIPVGKGRAGAPFRVGVRSGAAVDRVTGAVAGHSVACLEFAPGAGFWMAVAYANDDARAMWSQVVAGALRLLGDTGFGGERSRGWGRSEAVEIRDAGGAFAPFAAPEGEHAHETGWWLLSLFSPADDEQVDWTRGAFATVTRSGRARSGELKRSSRMIAEGSVLMSGSALRGVARDVAPETSQHPIYRWGAAFAVPAAVRAS